jgi:hypothetical protein
MFQVYNGSAEQKKEKTGRIHYFRDIQTNINQSARLALKSGQAS